MHVHAPVLILRPIKTATSATIVRLWCRQDNTAKNRHKAYDRTWSGTYCASPRALDSNHETTQWLLGKNAPHTKIEISLSRCPTRSCSRSISAASPGFCIGMALLLWSMSCTDSADSCTKINTCCVNRLAKTEHPLF